MKGKRAYFTEEQKAEIARKYDDGERISRLRREYHIGTDKLTKILQEKSNLYHYSPSSKAKKCAYCGRYAPPDALFCPYCGKDIRSERETKSQELLMIRAAVVKYLPEGAKLDIDKKLLDLRNWVKDKGKESK